MQRKTLDEHLGAFLPPLLSGIRLAHKHLQPATFGSCVPLLVAPCMTAILSIEDQSVQISVVLPMVPIRRRVEQKPRRDGSPVRYAKFESIRYFIDIDILQNCLIDIDIDIDIFQNHHIDIDIDIDIFGIALSISIFFKSVDISTIDMSYRYIEQGYLSGKSTQLAE